MINITNDSGSIRITDDVFTLLAGDAATSCFGVKSAWILASTLLPSPAASSKRSAIN